MAAIGQDHEPHWRQHAPCLTRPAQPKLQKNSILSATVQGVPSRPASRAQEAISQTRQRRLDENNALVAYGSSGEHRDVSCLVLVRLVECGSGAAAVALLEELIGLIESTHRIS
jgi:hypothetical protein